MAGNIDDRCDCRSVVLKDDQGDIFVFRFADSVSVAVQTFYLHSPAGGADFHKLGFEALGDGRKDRSAQEVLISPPKPIIARFIKHRQPLRPDFRSGVGMGCRNNHHFRRDAVGLLQFLLNVRNDFRCEHQDFHIAKNDWLAFNLQKHCRAFQFIQHAVRFFGAHAITAHETRLIRRYVPGGSGCFDHFCLNRDCNNCWLKILLPSRARSNTLRPST